MSAGAACGSGAGCVVDRAGGMVAVGEFVDKLGVVAASIPRSGAVKRRDRGMSAGNCWWSGFGAVGRGRVLGSSG